MSQAVIPNPLLIGLKHFGLGIVAMALLCLGGAFYFTTAGDATDIGPKVSIAIPKYSAQKKILSPGAVDEVANANVQQNGILKLWPWLKPAGEITWWDPSRAPEKSSSMAQVKDPHIPSNIEAASAPPLGAENGTNIHGGITTENGVDVMRGNVNGNFARSPLTAAPISGLYVQTSIGPLPIVSSDGRTAFDVYKRPSSSSGRAKVALVVGALGLNARVTERAITQLPPEVTLSFVPYATNLQGWINKARAAGHEVLIELPLEPHDFSDNDTGPQTLLTDASYESNQKKLEFLLSRANGYFAVTNYMGGKFAESNAAVTALMTYLKSHGIGFIGDGSVQSLYNSANTLGLHSAASDRTIDARPTAADIAAQLGGLEAIATQRGTALGFGQAYAVTIDAIIIWAQGAQQRGITLVPASSSAS